MSRLEDPLETRAGESAGWWRGRDVRVALLELYVLFVGSVLIGALVFSSAARTRLEDDAAAADQALASAIARAVAVQNTGDENTEDSLASLLDVATAGRPAVILVIDADGNVLARLDEGQIIPADGAWPGWQTRVASVALKRESGLFTTDAPDGQEWLHAFASTPSSDYWAVVQRPKRNVFIVVEGFQRVLLLAAVVFVLGGVLFWWVLSRRVITPLEKLEVFSGLIRWRGQLRQGEEVPLRELAERPDQVGSLALSLAGMAQGIEDRLTQLSSLLETSRIVAASLNVPEVMNNILIQLQRLFRAERCAIVALDSRAGIFRIRASQGLSESYVNQLGIDPAEPTSPSMRALRNKTPIQVSDTEADLSFTNLRPRARKEGFRSVLAIPLSTHYSPPAVLLLYKSQPYRYSYRELELASSFANHASIALENAALHALTDQRLHKQTRQLEATVESLSDGLVLESLGGEVLYCNQKALAMAGRQHALAAGAKSLGLIGDLLRTAVPKEETWAAWQAAASGEGTRSVDISRQQADGRMQDLRINLFDVTDANGARIGRGQLWQDITHDKEVDRTKSALLATVSHELRTPLAAIKGYATTLLADDVKWDPAAQREFLETISREADQLTRLVKNLLDMSRLEAGTLTIRQELHALGPLVRRVADHVEPTCNCRVRLHLASDLPLVLVDASRIETVLRNLLENAAKFGPPDAAIDVAVMKENGQVVVQVRDAGPGIPEGMQDKIFDRFYRGNSALSRERRGVGLGLAICKGFVEAHGGQVWVENGQPGAVFSFSLPASNGQQ